MYMCLSVIPNILAEHAVRKSFCTKNATDYLKGIGTYSKSDIITFRYYDLKS